MTSLDDRIKAGNFAISQSKSNQQMEIQWMEAEMKWAAHQAEMVKKWIENELLKVKLHREQEKLRQFMEAYDDYIRRITGLKKEIKNSQRKQKRINGYVRDASFILEGEYCNKPRQACNGLLILIRELGVVHNEARKILYDSRSRSELPAIGSQNYHTILDALEIMGERADEQLTKLALKVEKTDQKLIDIQSKHWEQVEII